MRIAVAGGQDPDDLLQPELGYSYSLQLAM